MRLGCYLLILITLFYPVVGFSSKKEGEEEKKAKVAYERPTLAPTLELLNKTIRENYHPLSDIPLSHLRKIIRKTTFLPIDYLRAGQLSFAYLTVRGKIQGAYDDFKPEWIEAKGIWKLDKHNDDRRSLFPEKKSALAVLGPDGIYLTDGHHKVLTSLYYGATTFPITIMEDLSLDSDGKPLSTAAFRKLMKERGHVFLTRPDGSEADWVPRLDNLSNDPNRYFVTLITAKLKIKYEDGYAQIKKRRGTDYPVLVKIGRDAEFFELAFSKRLHAAGIHYNDLYEDHPPYGFIEAAARILWERREAGDPFLKNVLMFPHAIYRSTRELEVLLNEFLQHNSSACEALLSRREDKYF